MALHPIGGLTVGVQYLCGEQLQQLLNLSGEERKKAVVATWSQVSSVPAPSTRILEEPPPTSTPDHTPMAETSLGLSSTMEFSWPVFVWLQLAPENMTGVWLLATHGLSYLQETNGNMARDALQAVPCYLGKCVRAEQTRSQEEGAPTRAGGHRSSTGFKGPVIWSVGWQHEEFVWLSLSLAHRLDQ